MGSDRLDSVFFRELFIERVRIVGFVADKPLWEFVELKPRTPSTSWLSCGEALSQIRRLEDCDQRR
jgi:hypothetical protein